ncbi:hypothetical protein MKW94_021915 [Papaver nudicaule]|uniref:Protein kinase domain-containing protein n=1 Tax=Papaver nudicaule TaxID=74823 RepID=A0AA41V761_PAPNU|nr:hypothetical protein [Papaver nudicaule]
MCTSATKEEDQKKEEENPNPDLYDWGWILADLLVKVNYGQREKDSMVGLVTMKLILEYAGKGELYGLLSKNKHLTEKQAATCNLAKALANFHEKHIIHRDIKPENLLLDLEGRLKVADFGWSVQSRSKRHTMRGTLDYLAPEMVENKGHDYTVDTWTMGILCYEFLFGVPPFEAETQKETFERIKKLDYSFPPTPHVSVEAKNLVRLLLVKDPSKRLPLTKILVHPWIVKNADPSGACSE